jgi:hypothetical protein
MTHALYPIHEKFYKQILRKFKNNFLTAATVRQTELNVTFVSTWTSFDRNLNQDSITSSWSISIHITTCSGEPDSNLWISKSKRKIQLLKSQRFKFQKLHLPEVFHKFLFLTGCRYLVRARVRQYTGPIYLQCCQLWLSWRKNKQFH